MSEGKELNLLDDDYLPEHIRLAQVIGNPSLPISDRIQHLINVGLLNSGRRDDKMILSRLKSEEHGHQMLAYISNQLRKAVGHPIVEIFCSDNLQTTMDASSRESRAETGLGRGHVDLVQRFRNEVRGPKGERFVEILYDSESGSVMRYDTNLNRGHHNVAHFLYAQSCNLEKTKVVAKFRIEDSRNGNDTLMHEHMTLLNLKSVKNVVKLWGDGIYDVHGRKALTLCFTPHGSSDNEALMYLNINDLHAITSQILPTFLQVHKTDTFHLNLEARHLLYHQQTNKIVISGWGSSISKGKKSPTDSLLDRCRDFEKLSNSRKDAILVARTLLNLICRLTKHHRVEELMNGNIRQLIDDAAVQFNKRVADKRLEIEARHPLFNIVKALLTGEIENGLKFLSEWTLIPASEVDTLFVPARFCEDLQRMQYPAEIFKRNCVDSNGKILTASGLRSFVSVPSKDALLAEYGGRSIDSAKSTDLVRTSDATHVIGGASKKNLKDGRKIGNGIYDAHFYAREAQVYVLFDKKFCHTCALNLFQMLPFRLLLSSMQLLRYQFLGPNRPSRSPRNWS